MTYVQLDGHEARPVQVQMDDGIWAEGFLEAYRKVEGVWSGYVRYSVKPGETYLGWFEEPPSVGTSPTDPGSQRGPTSSPSARGFAVCECPRPRLGTRASVTFRGRTLTGD